MDGYKNRRHRPTHYVDLGHLRQGRCGRIRRRVLTRSCPARSVQQRRDPRRSGTAISANSRLSAVVRSEERLFGGELGRMPLDR